MTADALRTQLEALPRHRGDLIEKGSYDFVQVKHEEEWIRASDLDAVLTTLQGVQEPPKRACMEPAPDRTGRTCDKPQGHDGDHWTYGMNGLTWPVAARAPHPERTEPASE